MNSPALPPRRPLRLLLAPALVVLSSILLLRVIGQSNEISGLKEALTVASTAAPPLYDGPADPAAQPEVATAEPTGAAPLLQSELDEAREEIARLEAELSAPTSLAELYLSSVCQLLNLDTNLSKLELTLLALERSNRSADPDVVALGVRLLRELAPNDSERIRMALADLRTRLPGPPMWASAEYLGRISVTSPDVSVLSSLHEIADSEPFPDNWGAAMALMLTGVRGPLDAWVDAALEVVRGDGVGALQILGACEATDFEGRDDILVSASTLEGLLVRRRLIPLLVALGTERARAALQRMYETSDDLLKPILVAALRNFPQ